MEQSDVILIVGIIAALIWICACVIIEGKNRKYVIMIGIIIDIVLFIICKSCDMLFIGVLGGLLCGFTGFGYKYETAVREMKGVKNWVVVSIIFFVMVVMTMAIAYPNLKVEL